MSYPNPATSDDPSGAELRAEQRIAVLLRAGRLVTPTGEFLCILRAVSANGIKVRLFHDLPDPGPFTLELGNEQSYPLELVWQRDGHAGFRFVQGSIDIQALVDEAGDYPKRQIRLRLTLPVAIADGRGERAAELRDISQNGALIMIEPSLAIGQRVRLECDGLPLLEAAVRWRRHKAHGLVFQRSFRMDELAQIARMLQHDPAADGSRPIHASH